MKKLLSILLTLSMVFAMATCALAEAAPETRTVVDVWNREVEIPFEVNSIVCLGSMGPRFAAYLDVVDMMVGAEDMDIEKMSVRFDYSPVYHEQLKTLPSVGPGGGSGENNGYAEAIIQAQPDVIIAGFNEDDCNELQAQTGIPVVSIRYRTKGFIDEGFYRSMRVFAEVVGAQERCEEVLSYVDACKADLNDRTKDVPDEDKPRAYTGAVTFNGRHGFAFTYVNFPAFTAVNALNVADVLLEERTGEAAAEAAASGKAYIGNDGFEVDLEQIIAWDPDIVFLDPGNMDLVNDEYANNPGFFDSLRAIQEGQVYTMPSTNAAGPNVTYLLINAYYAGTILYPEQFADIILEEKAGEIMELMLGEDFFDQMQEGGLYYGTITIGA
ncbi:MAG: ABC transporter substrate-binding protein [Clostridia bacterium]|nr:ABC transporter substrate-binding protein [Clostridia bacterium]